MAYAGSVNTVKRIDTLLKKAPINTLNDADKINITLTSLDALSKEADQSLFTTHLEDFLTNNEHFRDAFRYEGLFTKNAFFGKWSRRESSDINRSKTILKGLIYALEKRIGHLNAQKTAVQDKIKAHVGALSDNDQIFANHLCRKFEVTFNSLDEYFKYYSPQGQLKKMNDFVTKYGNDKPTKDQSSAIATMTQYVGRPKAAENA